MRILDTTLLKAAFLAAITTSPSLHGASVAAALPPIESFFQNSQTSAAELSPDGRSVALRVASKGGRAKLAVLDLQTMKAAPVAAFDDSDIANFDWVNPQRLVFSVTDLQSAAGERQKSGQGGGLFAVNRDGSAFKQLVERSYHPLKNGDSKDALPPNTFLQRALSTKEGDDVIVSEPHAFDKNGRAWDYVALQRLNTRTGRTTDIDVPMHSQRWLFDTEGTPRIALASQNGRSSVHYLDKGLHKWRQLIEFNPLREPGFEPLWFDADGSLYVRAAIGRDKAAVYRYDLATNQLGTEPVVASADFDMDGHVVAAQGKMLGYRYSIDAEVTQWFDADMKATQQTVDALLP
ncbi:MAG: S9 family peptidase, partial [Pseudomonadota bacterium]|nr:S9 family peptidase [Pseudomonadota bacterium]